MLSGVFPNSRKSGPFFAKKSENDRKIAAMDKLIKPGRYIFVAGIFGLAILCILSKDFIIGRPPAWPARLTVNPALAYGSATVLILASLALLFRKAPGFAALVIALLIFLLSVVRHLPEFMNDWLNSWKSIALFGGALIVSASFFEESEPRPGKKGWKKGFIITGSVLLSAFFIACGYAHFRFADFVRDFIPSYIPFHVFWTYFCGICLFAGGLGLLIPTIRPWAALLSGIMTAGWFLLLHIPRFLANTADPGDRMGLLESLTFAGIFFVLAGVLSKKTKSVSGFKQGPGI
jgi:uncharacterized membrane protein